MDNTLLVKIQQIVSEQLPQATAGELKKYIENAESISRELEKKNEKIKELEQFKLLYNELYGKNSAIDEKEKALLKREKELNEKELLIEKRQRGFELEIANIKVSEAQMSKIDLFELVNKVFGHPSVSISNKKNMSVEKFEPYQGGGGYWSTKNDTEENTETRTESKQ